MIAIVDYGVGNLFSLKSSFAAIGADVTVTGDASALRESERIVLPGVGAFTDAANAMRELGQDKVIVERINAGVPFLGICLGLHLMFEGGTEHAEGDSTPGLGLIPGIVDAMPKNDLRGNAFKIPHVGWNSVDYLSNRPNPLFKNIPDGEYFYFTHSFIAPHACETIATTTHSVTFPSVVQVGKCAYGVQFHPEKSSDAGAKLLANFVELSKAR